MRTLKVRSCPSKARWRCPGAALRFFGSVLPGDDASSGVAALGADVFPVRWRFRGAGGAAVASALALVAAAVAGAALAVEASAKNGDDGKYVLGELELGRSGGVIRVCVHDDLRTVLGENKLDEIECEPAEPVFVGNVHRS